MGIQVKQQFFTPEEVYEADGAFLVGTAAEVSGIRSLNDHVFPKEWKHTFGYQLQKEYEMATRRDDDWEENRLG
jgi:branched-chain amino acid aminotransferase